MWVRNVWWAVENHCGWCKRFVENRSSKTRQTYSIYPSSCPDPLESCNFNESDLKELSPPYLFFATREHHYFLFESIVFLTPLYAPLPARHLFLYINDTVLN